MIRKILITCLLLLGISAGAWAQEKTITVTGTVIDEENLPMIGVNIVVQDMPGLGVITDINGKYSIKMPAYNRLEFSYLGYKKKVVLVKEQTVVNVTRRRRLP